MVRDRAAVRRYSPRTTQAYVQWIVRYVRWNGLRHPATLGGVEVRDFLTYLARERNVAASTQNQALAALHFLYRDVLEQPLGEVSGLAPARRPTHLPKVLSREAVLRVLACLTGVPLLMAQLLYGSGLRLQEECCQLRVKDLDFERGELRVRRGKGDRDRVTVLSGAVGAPLRAHLARVRAVMARRAAHGGGFVALPGALDRKIPRASQQWGWCWVFPAAREYWHEESQSRRTHHVPPHGGAACGGRGRPAIGRWPAGRVSYLPAFVCPSPAGVWGRYPNRAGVAWAQGCEDHDAVYTRAESWRAARTQPAGHRAVTGASPASLRAKSD